MVSCQISFTSERYHFKFPGEVEKNTQNRRETFRQNEKNDQRQRSADKGLAEGAAQAQEAREPVRDEGPPRAASELGPVLPIQHAAGPPVPHLGRYELHQLLDQE